MSSLFDTPIALYPLRPRQEAFIAGIRDAIRAGHKRIVGQAPTGSGKTIVASHIIAGALDKGRKPLFCVPRLSLIDQTVKRFEAQGIHDIGVIQGDHDRTDPLARVQIASVYTLVRRPLPDIDFVIVDEVHLSLEAFDAILNSEAWANKIVIGLSATPWTKGMGRRWTKLVPFGTTKDLIAEGWLTPVVAYGVPDDYMPDVSKVHTNFDGEYVESEAEAAMTTAPIVGNVVRTWLEKWGKDKTFMFCVNRSHARKMQKEFEDAGVSCGYIDGTMDADARERLFQKYRAGEYRIIASIDTIGIGVDEDVRCVIYLRLTKSEMKWVQDGGRSIRLADGKESALLLDHAGTCEALGLFTDIHHDTLDMHDPKEKGQPFKGDKTPKPHKCPKCNAIVPRSVQICPICHAVMPRGKTPRQVDGELILVNGQTPKQKKAKAELPRTEWFGGLLWIARERGERKGWPPTKFEGVAAAQYREKFGCWPNGMAKMPTPPKAEVIGWEKHQRIKYAKGMQKRETA